MVPKIHLYRLILKISGRLKTNQIHFTFLHVPKQVAQMQDANDDSNMDQATRNTVVNLFNGIFVSVPIEFSTAAQLQRSSSIVDPHILYSLEDIVSLRNQVKSAMFLNVELCKFVRNVFFLQEKKMY